MVSLDSLQVLADLISELENIVNIIKHTNGSISDHISVLKNVVINYKDFIPTDNLDQEQQIAQRLINTIMTLKDTTVIGDVSVSYFAENIRSMLMEYESETFDEMSPLSLAVVTAEQHGQRTAGKRSFGDASADWTTARNTVKIHRQLKKEFCRMRSLLLSPGKHKRKGRMFSVSGNTLKCT